MKQFILVILLCISTFGIAQNSTSERTITVYGSAKKNSVELIYKTDVTLSLESGYYAENPCTTLEELEAKYFEELKNLNIDTSKFIRDDLAYAASGYRKDGTVLRFETKDKAEILKVTSIRMTQAMPSYVQVKSVISEAEIKILTKQALADARKNAELLAESAGEEVDKIYSIGGSYSSDGDEYWRSPSIDPEYYRLTVVYTLKD